MVIHSLSRLLVSGVLLLGLALLSTAQADEEFPLRDRYEAVGLEMIELDDLARRYAQVQIVDVRSEYEFETLRIADSVLIPVDDYNFLERIRALAAETGKPLVFYCNGKTCEKSYQAGLVAMDHGVDNVLVFDAGLFDWATTQPERTLLFGEPLGSTANLISGQQFRRHLLAPSEFQRRLQADPNAVVLDVRDSFQREGVSLFNYRDQHVPLDNQRLQEWVDKARNENVPLYVVDATGRQVQWLQYFLEANGLRDYWFMEGGARAYFDEMISQRFAR